jgi:hypothetical protein
MYLKYKITEQDVNRGSAKNVNGVGIVTTTGTANIPGEEQLRLIFMKHQILFKYQIVL